MQDWREQVYESYWYETASEDDWDDIDCDEYDEDAWVEDEYDEDEWLLTFDSEENEYGW